MQNIIVTLVVMKNLITYCFALILFLAACKKDVKTAPITVTKPTSEAVFPPDSVSYTIDGKNHVLNNAGGVTTGNTDANRKVDSVIDGTHFYISGNKDSVFFYRTFDFTNAGGSPNFNIAFFKKFAAKDMLSAGILYPADQTSIFEPGNYQYGTDYTRENATNGVALTVNGIGQTYSNLTLGFPTTITAASESGAHFQVLSFKKLSDDTFTAQYLIEAKFDASLFADDGITKQQLTNGYIRMVVAIAHQ